MYSCFCVSSDHMVIPIFSYIPIHTCIQYIRITARHMEVLLLKAGEPHKIIDFSQAVLLFSSCEVNVDKCHL